MIILEKQFIYLFVSQSITWENQQVKKRENHNN